MPAKTTNFINSVREEIDNLSEEKVKAVCFAFFPEDATTELSEEHNFYDEAKVIFDEVLGGGYLVSIRTFLNLLV